MERVFGAPIHFTTLMLANTSTTVLTSGFDTLLFNKVCDDNDSRGNDDAIKMVWKSAYHLIEQCPPFFLSRRLLKKKSKI